MLNEPKTLDPKHGDAKKRDAKQNDSGRDDSGRDSSAEFIHELAESGAASELGTVKAASDAAEKEGRASGKTPSPDKDQSEKSD